MTNMFSLEGHIALVTGSAQGLGNRIARGMLDAGAKVVLSDISQTALDKAVAELKEEGYDAAAYAFDISNEEQVEKAVAQIEEQVGPIDILVNNAGIIKRIPMIEMSAEDFRQVIDIDLNAP